MRKASGALVVFDVTNPKSFASLPYWIETLRERALSESVQIMIVGNKIDRAQHRAVSLGEAEQMASRYGLAYCETSASDLSSLNSIFREICERKPDWI